MTSSTMRLFSSKLVVNLLGKRVISSLPRCFICSVFTFPSLVSSDVIVNVSSPFLASKQPSIAAWLNLSLRLKDNFLVPSANRLEF